MSGTRARIPLNTFAIGFGLAGLAEVWGAASAPLHLPDAVAQAFWLVATVAWVWLIAAHVVRGARSGDRLIDQLRHPGQGPIAALVTVTGMLVSGELLTVSPIAGTVLLLLSITVAAVFAGWLIGSWLQGGLQLESVHGGYLLPTVAAGLVGADVAARAGLAILGWALFGVGSFFWVVMTVLLLIRLAFRPSLPDPLVPTMAILVAPPGVAGLAWFALDGDRLDPVAGMIAGLAVLLVLVQLALLPKYRRLPFSLGFWSFTFPTAAIVADVIVWLRLAAVPGQEVVDAILVVAVTGLVGSIAVMSLRQALPPTRRSRAEAALADADAADAVVAESAIPA